MDLTKDRTEKEKEKRKEKSHKKKKAPKKKSEGLNSASRSKVMPRFLVKPRNFNIKRVHNLAEVGQDRVPNYSSLDGNSQLYYQNLFKTEFEMMAKDYDMNLKLEDILSRSLEEQHIIRQLCQKQIRIGERVKKYEIYATIGLVFLEVGAYGLGVDMVGLYDSQVKHMDNYRKGMRYLASQEGESTAPADPTKNMLMAAMGSMGIFILGKLLTRKVKHPAISALFKTVEGAILSNIKIDVPPEIIQKGSFHQFNPTPPPSSNFYQSAMNTGMSAFNMFQHQGV